MVTKITLNFEFPGQSFTGIKLHNYSGVLTDFSMRIFIVVLADAHFPTSSVCRHGPKEIRADGNILKSVLGPLKIRL